MSIHNIIKFQFSLIILFQIFYKISAKTSFDYLYSINLPNDNIFLIQKTGIDIYDMSLNKLNQIIQFSGEEEISEEKFSKIAIKYNNEYILSVINDKMFIFNNEGKILYKSEEKINDNQTIYSYSLTLINTTNNTCDYVLGYFDEDNYLNLSLYRYDNESSNITLLYGTKSEKHCNKYECYNYTSNNKLLSCEYIYYNYIGSLYKNMFVCFYNLDNTKVGIAYYDHQIYNNKLSLNREISFYSINLNNPDKNFKYITSIKSEINNNRTLTIIWWNFNGNNQTRFFIYDMKEDKAKWSSKMPNTCINEEYGTRINVFPAKDQISFSCVIKDENVQILLYNKTTLESLTSTYDPYLINASCENINRLSSLYYNDNKNYYIYSCLKNCSDKNYENDSYCLNIKRDEENKRRITMIIIIVTISVIIIALLIVLIIICRKKIENWKNKKIERDWKKGQEDEKLMNDIMSDLLPNN